MIQHYGDVLQNFKDSKPKPINTPEKAVKPACVSLLESWGLKPIRNNTGIFTKKYKSKSGRQTTHWIHCGLEGSGDTLLVNNIGRWVEIEYKATNGEQRDEQIERQQYVESCGGLYIVARSLDDLIARQSEIMGLS